MKTLKLNVRPDQIAVIEFDAPQSSVNVLSRDSMSELEQALDEIFRDSNIKGCVLTSAKKECFLAGADLEGLSHVSNAKEAEKLSHRAQEVFNRIARSPIPFVAAVNGVALGGGLEIALACHLRVASDNPKTVFALPEVQLGLLPGAGGTQRLPRLIGLTKALPIILSGSRIRAKKALKMGLINALVSEDALIETAAKKVLALSEKSKGKSVRAPEPRLSFADRALSSNVLGALPRSVLLSQTRKQVLKKTRGHYPAPLAILKCIESGFKSGVERGFAKEAELFGKLVASSVSKNLVWIFHANNELKKAEVEKAHSVNKLAVIGAGLMGQGIASVSLPLSPSGVIIKDVTEQALAKATTNIFSQLEKRVAGGSLQEADMKLQQERLFCTTENEKLIGSDLIIEAVFEDLNLKRKVLSEVEKVVFPNAVFASNTSALPISEIAEGSKHPERVLGMHYFSPVPKMPLLEIIITPKTSAEALATAQAYGIAQGKTVIVVKDGPGFYTTRILAPLLNESMLLLEEGATIEGIDRALKKFGFPVGPILLLDEVGIDVGAHVAQDLGNVFGARWGAHSGALEKMVKAGFLGKKNGRGFYTAKKTPNTEVYQYFGGARPTQSNFDDKTIADRVSLMMVSEAVHCLLEGVIRCARDGDIGAIMGLGFPPFLGGPFHYIDSVGAANIVERMNELAAANGARFEPPALVVEKARQNTRFY